MASRWRTLGWEKDVIFVRNTILGDCSNFKRQKRAMWFVRKFPCQAEIHASGLLSHFLSHEGMIPELGPPLGAARMHEAGHVLELIQAKARSGFSVPQAE